MAILTVDEVREHVETDLPDTALQRLIDNADQEIIDSLGALASQVEVLSGQGLRDVALIRKAVSITSVVERLNDTDYTLAASDFELLADKYRIQRLQGSNEPSFVWRGRVTITYVPEDETAAREKLLIDLVRLDAAYDAKQQSSIGDVSCTSLDHAKERNALFDQVLSRKRRLRMA